MIIILVHLTFIDHDGRNGLTLREWKIDTENMTGLTSHSRRNTCNYFLITKEQLNGNEKQQM